MRKISIMPHGKGKNIKGIKCPYLSNGPKRICVKMVEADLDAGVSQFDAKHFCMGNPNNCYFFRVSSQKQKSST